MIAITNISRGIPDNEPHEYAVSINLGKPLAKFSHIRGDGLAACLRAAADAIDAIPIDTRPPVDSNLSSGFTRGSEHVGRVRGD